MPRKGVIVYAGTGDWFHGKIDFLYKGSKTIVQSYILQVTAVVMLVSSYIAGLDIIAASAMAKLMPESLVAGFAKNYGMFCAI